MLSDTKKRIFGRLQNFLKTSKFAQCETWWNQLCSYCALHVNCGFISNQAMCATQFEKDQKDALLHFLLAGFHVKWFHHPSWSWPNCWQKLRQPYWIYWGCFGPTRGRISDDKCSRNARWTISYETKSSLLSLFFSWMWLLSELHAVAHLSFYQLRPSDDLLTPPAIESQLDANSPRICRKSVWRIFSQRHAQQEGTALKLYFGQMVRQWGRQIG